MIGSVGEMERLDHLDRSLESAIAMATETKTMTPVIKHELKVAILERRHRRGEVELPVDNDHPTSGNELTPEEKRKKMKRKEQNRRAAQRCREKKRQLRELVQQEYILEQQKTEALVHEIEKLRREKAALQQAFDDHIFSCTQNVTPNQTPTFDEQTTFTFPPDQPEGNQWGFDPQNFLDLDQLQPSFEDQLPEVFNEIDKKDIIPNNEQNCTVSTAEMMTNQYMEQMHHFPSDLDVIRPTDFGL